MMPDFQSEPESETETDAHFEGGYPPSQSNQEDQLSIVEIWSSTRLFADCLLSFRISKKRIWVWLYLFQAFGTISLRASVSAPFDPKVSSSRSRWSLSGLEPPRTEVGINYKQIREILLELAEEIGLMRAKELADRSTNFINENFYSLDRKIDRGYVKRLFDKFRSLVKNLNVLVKELSDQQSEFASKDDLELVGVFLEN